MADRMHITIRVRGQLVPGQWRAWFDGLTLEPLPDGEMQLSGSRARSSRALRYPQPYPRSGFGADRAAKFGGVSL